MDLLARAFINEGVRAGIPDLATRTGTITLYLDKAALLQSLDLPGDDDTHVLLIDRKGTVFWRASGAFTPAAGQSLAEKLATLMAEPVPQGQTRQ